MPPSTPFGPFLPSTFHFTKCNHFTQQIKWHRAKLPREAWAFESNTIDSKCHGCSLADRENEKKILAVDYHVTDKRLAEQTRRLRGTLEAVKSDNKGDKEEKRKLKRQMAELVSLQWENRKIWGDRVEKVNEEFNTRWERRKLF